MEFRSKSLCTGPQREPPDHHAPLAGKDAKPQSVTARFGELPPHKTLFHVFSSSFLQILLTYHGQHTYDTESSAVAMVSLRMTLAINTAA